MALYDQYGSALDNRPRNAKTDDSTSAARVATMAFADCHTEGEWTRVVYEGLPPVNDEPPARLLEHLRQTHPRLRAAIVDEPRGAEALVAALLFEPTDAASLGRVLFCNNVGWLPMCVHATIGLARTLVHLGRIDPKDSRTHNIDTPAGRVGFRIRDHATVEVDNVAARRLQAGLVIEAAYGAVSGDVAWGGNWFFVVRDSPLAVRASELTRLHALAREIRTALAARGLRGDDGREIDHIQLCGSPERAGANAKNFVLCPGGAHDRSPCGTGTSARVACLVDDGELQPGETWTQEGITGTIFRARYRRDGTTVLPTIEGRAFMTAEGRLLFDAEDEIAGLR